MLLKILIFAFYLWTKIVNSKKSSCYMPPKCGWFDSHKSLKKANLYCKPTYANLLDEVTIHFNSKNNLFNRRQLILNNSFQLLNITRYFLEILDDYVLEIKLNFYNLRGFQADLMISGPEKAYFANMTIEKRHFSFVDVDFNIYSRNGTLVTTCQDFRVSAGPDLFARNVFWGFWVDDEGYAFEDHLHIENARFPNSPMCPLLFLNASLDTLEISGLIRCDFFIYIYKLSL